MSDKYADKRAEFAVAVAENVEAVFLGNAQWDWFGDKSLPGSVPYPHVWVNTECDYEPMGLLIDAIVRVFGDAAKGVGNAGQDFLPRKHALSIGLDKLMPKEGYANNTAHIPVV